MAKYAIIKSFYGSEAWQTFRMVVINQRGLNCEYCSELVTKSNELTLHHKIELTPENVNDVLISLNPDNIMVVHHECHNKIHKRFGYKPSFGINIVYGPPLSGKKAYVLDRMSRGDIVVDMDRLYAAVSMQAYYDKPDGLSSNVFGIHNLLLDNIKTRLGKWNSAWVIGGYADKYKRDRLADELGADLIYCNVSQEECIRRLGVDQDLQYRKDEWLGYINKWFDQYRE